MIPVTPAAEPPHFDRTIRLPGLAAVDELVGRKPRVSRRGPRRKKIADREEDIPADTFPPLWRKALPDMLRDYHRRCAYLALYIEPATGNATVDHVTPKSQAWDQVYEWSNYRLCAALINAKKNVLATVLDPFQIQDGWFALDLVDFLVVVGPRAPARMIREIDSTIDAVGLNRPECCQQRKEYVEEYEHGHIDLDYLTRRAPFIASELRRQGQLRPSDLGRSRRAPRAVPRRRRRGAQRRS
jgi:hypothetical protein